MSVIRAVFFVQQSKTKQRLNAVSGPDSGQPILARAEALGVPIYLHPGIPSENVRAAHFDRRPGNFSAGLLQIRASEPTTILYASW